METIKIVEKNKDYFKKVYAVVRLIPCGKITTYGAIARYLGSGKGARMVGWALNACMGKDDVPAHRVVNRLGVLSGKMHFATPQTMCERLEIEGTIVNNDRVVDFQSRFWDPARELEL